MTPLRRPLAVLLAASLAVFPSLCYPQDLGGGAPSQAAQQQSSPPAPSAGAAQSAAPGSLASACAFDTGLCQRAQVLASQEQRLYQRTVLGPRPGEDELGAVHQDFITFCNDLEVKAHALGKTIPEAYNAFSYLDPYVNSLGWMMRVNADKDLASLGDDLSALDKKVTQLEADAARVTPGADPEARDPLLARLHALSAEGGELWRRVEAVSANVNATGQKVQFSKGPDGKENDFLTASGHLTDRVNPFQEHVAALARRTQQLAHELGEVVPADFGGKGQLAADNLKGRLDDPFKGGPPPDPGATGSAVAAGPAGGVGLLDIRRVPAPGASAKPWPPDRPLFTGRTGRDADPRETARIQQLVKAGKTTTYGDPVGRARYVFHQTGETCAIAAQAEVLAELQGAPPGAPNMRALETQLYNEAEARGYFIGDSGDPKLRWKGTTPNQYAGGLLGVPVRYTALATTDQLDAAAKTGRPLLVTGNTGQLWNDSRFAKGGHTIEVTGALADDHGAVLGYFINDTGTDEGGRFVTRAQFLRYWQRGGRVIVEPQ